MPVKLELTENNRVLHVTFTDPWDIDDMTQLFAEDAAARNRFSYRIHTLVDMSASLRLPSGALRARYSPSVTHARRGHMALVVGSPLFKSVGEMVFRLAHFQDMKFCDTTDEAWAYLRNLIATEEVQFDKRRS